MYNFNPSQHSTFLIDLPKFFTVWLQNCCGPYPRFVRLMHMTPPVPPSADVACERSLEPDELLLDVPDGDDEGERDPDAADVLDELVDADAQDEAVPLNAQHPEKMEEKFAAPSFFVV